MTLYGTGMRRSELARLKLSDIDSQRMIVRVVAAALPFAAPARTVEPTSIPHIDC
jgi:integrase